jgi:hypothetical protein
VHTAAVAPYDGPKSLNPELPRWSARMIVQIEIKHILSDEEIFECVLEFLSQSKVEIMDKLKEFAIETSALRPQWRKSTALARLTLLVEALDDDDDLENDD